MHLVELSVMDQRYQAVMGSYRMAGRSQKSPNISAWLVRGSIDGSPATRPAGCRLSPRSVNLHTADDPPAPGASLRQAFPTNTALEHLAHSRGEAGSDAAKGW